MVLETIIYFLMHKTWFKEYSEEKQKKNIQINETNSEILRIWLNWFMDKIKNVEICYVLFNCLMI